MRCSGPRLVEVRTRARLDASRGTAGASWWAGVCRKLEAGRAALGGEAEAWGKSKAPVVKGKVAGGGDGDEGGLGIGDVAACSHGRHSSEGEGRAVEGSVCKQQRRGVEE
jgi:hypothetical protein